MTILSVLCKNALLWKVRKDMRTYGNEDDYISDIKPFKMYNIQGRNRERR